MSLNEKVIVITGAGRGIGKSLAKVFSHAGARLVLASRTQEELEKLKQELSGDVHIIPTDIRKEEECNALIEKTIAHYGTIDVLINNAGVATYGLVNDVTSAQIQATIDTNLMGTIHCSRAAFLHMKKQGSGHIINISSAAGKVGLKGETGYCASKWGVNGFTAALGQEAKSFGVKVTVVCQAGTNTPFWDNDQYYKPDTSTFLSPDEVAEMICDIASKGPNFNVEEIVIRSIQSKLHS